MTIIHSWLTRRMRPGSVRTVLLFVVLSAACGFRASASAAEAPSVSDRVNAIFDDISTRDDLESAGNLAAELLIEVALTRPATDHVAFAEAGLGVEVVQLLDHAESVQPAEALALLRKHPQAMRELAYLVIIDPNGDSGDYLDAVLARFAELDAEFGEDLNAFPGLTAAICVVHDREVKHRINENTGVTPGPVALFRFYRDHEDRMMFGVREVPGRLLVWVVDSTQSISDMTWALNKYAGDRAIGRRFFDIRYDYNHLRNGTPKKVTTEGFTLPNILQYGGVCADQAYFAVQVGKAIGVPATYTWGQGGEVSHAWVGYLQQAGRGRVQWNFDEGRYSAYQGVRGNAQNPQTGLYENDSVIGLLAESITLPPIKQRAAAAMLRAESMKAWIATQADGPAMLAQLIETSGLPAKRSASRNDRLDLLEAAIRLDVSNHRAWSRVAYLLSREDVPEATTRQWVDALVRLCANRYPDFMVQMLGPIVESIESPKRKVDIWDGALAKVRRRHDLSAEIRMTQGAIWEEAGDLKKAADCYEDVVTRYANGGPYVLRALDRFEQLLTDAGRPERIVVLYRETFRKLDLPDRMASQFAQQSNYYRVGSRYVEKLSAAGDVRTAERVAASIQQNTGLAAAP